MNDQIKALVKRNGILSFSKVVVDDPQYAKAISENDFVDLLMEEAKAYQRENESLGQAFSKIFQAQTPDGLVLRQAHQAVVKANRAVPVTERPSGTFDKLLGGDGKTSAYDQLVEKANNLRKFEPELSFDQAFAKVFGSPANRALAEQERRESRPVPTTYPDKGERQ